VIGFIGNEIAAQVRLRAGHQLQSPALVADGKHARVDGFVSLGVLASAAVVAVGLKLADRPRDHTRHPSHHLGELADDLEQRPRRNARQPRVALTEMAQTTIERHRRAAYFGHLRAT
jgi:hypothetical protein